MTANLLAVYTILPSQSFHRYLSFRIAEVGVAGADVLHREVIGQMPGAFTPRPACTLRSLRWMNAIAPSQSLRSGPAKTSESRYSRAVHRPGGE